MTILKTKFSRLELAIIVAIVIYLCSCTSPRTLHDGRYTYQQLKARGYDCRPFKGVHYIKHTSDSTKADIVCGRQH